MIPIEILREKIQKQFSTAHTDLYSPNPPNRTWSLDLCFEKRHVIVTWSMSAGFYLYDISELECFISNVEPDEVCFDLETAFRWVINRFLGA